MTRRKQAKVLQNFMVYPHARCTVCGCMSPILQALRKSPLKIISPRHSCQYSRDRVRRNVPHVH